MSKYIQSFYQYPVTFSSIGKTMPARMASGEMKNLAEVSDAEYEKLQNAEPFFRELVEKKKYRVLNKIPASYVPAAVQVNEAKAEAEALKNENEILKAKLEAMEKAAAEKEATSAKKSRKAKIEAEKAATEATETESENATASDSATETAEEKSE